MLLKIRKTKTMTYEALVEVPSGLYMEETLAQAEYIADRGAWRPVDEKDSPVEIVEASGRIPTIRKD